MSNLLESLLLVGMLLGALLTVVIIVTRGHRPRYLLEAAIAGRWKGKVHAGGIFSGSWIELQVDGVPGEVTFAESNSPLTSPSPGWTRVRLNWPTESRLRVIPEGFSSKLRRLLGGADIDFDEPYFDDRFWVESSHPVWARGILDPSVRNGLVAFSRRPESEVTLDVGPAGIVLRVGRVLVDDPNSLGDFIGQAAAILMKAKGLADALGVKLEPVRSQSGSACPVCGHPVAEAVFLCPTCRTPHHGDCWKYFGGCAIFGCRQRKR